MVVSVFPSQVSFAYVYLLISFKSYHLLNFNPSFFKYYFQSIPFSFFPILPPFLNLSSSSS